MSKKKKLAKINDATLGKLIEVQAVLEALSDIEQARYPTNIMIEIAKKKLLKIFNNIEITENILKTTD